MKRIRLLGVAIDPITMEEAVRRALEIMDGRSGAVVVTPNSDYLMRAQKLPDLRDIANAAFLSLPDGVGVLAAARLLGQRIPMRVSGIDFAESLLAAMARSGKSVYLLGAKPAVAARAAEIATERFPGLIIAGTHDGYFSCTDELQLLREINASSPDLLIVCLGSPRQELWMRSHAPELDVGMMAGLGGTLNVLSGSVRRAPLCWQRLGLEWLYRLLTQPWRFRRVLGASCILLTALQIKIGGYFKPWAKEN